MAAISRAARDRIFGAPGKVDKVTVLTPWGIKVQCHRLIAAVFLEACREAYQRCPNWRPKRIDSYNFRPIRGKKSPSMHGYALAFDFFITGPNVPPPGGVWRPDNPVPPEFAECFTCRGFRWGAGFSRVDEPHIEWPNGLPDHLATPAKPTPPSHTEDDMTQEQKVVLADGWVRDSYRRKNPTAPLVEKDVAYWVGILTSDPPKSSFGAVRDFILAH